MVDHDDNATAPALRRGMPTSYSQPLDGDATFHAHRRRAAMPRNHSLDDDKLGGPDDGGNHHIFYQHSTSLPEEALRRHRHLPPQHHQFSFGCPTAYLSLERIMSASAPGGGNGAEDARSTGPALAANRDALPEFMGSGGGQGIFKVPVRGALRTGCPPSLELRPHPFRETQVGTFLRTIACGGDQVWAGAECGVRVWYLEEAFGAADGAAAGRGDEEAAPFHESCRTPAALCLVVDEGNRLVWSGHKDGKIRSWKMGAGQRRDNGHGVASNSGGGGGGAGGFKEGLSWQAHRGPILCMTFTAKGDLWAGSEGGAVKSWPWESIQKSLSLKAEERHMAALLVERSFVDLRSLVTVGGVCSLPSADVRFLLSDSSRSKVWSGGSSSFALWNSHTKELLKVFNVDGHVENRVEVSCSHDPNVEEDASRAKHAAASRKDRSQGSVGFFQRSRNALMGAADAVRRVATKGAFGEDNRRTEAMAVSTDGMVWTGCANGALVRWDDNGNRIHELLHHSSSVVSLCAHGTRLWVGYASGNVHMLDLEGNLLGGWAAHSSPVVKMAVGGGFVFTLANHGGVRGWHLTSPGPSDGVLRSELTTSDQTYTRFESCKILVGTWNVGQERAAHDSLASWLGGAASKADIVIVGLQEIEMGAGFLAMAAAKETVGLEGSANGHWWLDAIGKTLDEGAAFERVGSRQLAGLLIAVWTRKSLRKHIGDVDAAAVACGFGRAIGNKGGVGLRMRIYGRIVCFANCHFAAHLEAVNKRNADFDHIFRTMSFSRPSNGHHVCGAGSSSVQVNRGPNAGGIQSDDGTPELAEADMIIFLGDFNYRLQGISYDEARDFVSQRCFDWLREKDQLREEMKAGKVFQGMREGLIRFPPTYKFERHRIGLSGYDSGEKKRIPAWCDRILYRDNRSISLQECSLECPIVSSILQYDACMDVTDSDHKPVRCLLAVEVAHIDKTVRRQEFGRILLSNEKIRSLLEENCTIPETTVSTNSITLQHQETFIFTITNKCDKDKAIVEISCGGLSTIKEDGTVTEPSPRGGYGFPRWLSVTPMLGVIKAGEALEVMLCLEETPPTDEPVDGIPQGSRCEDIKDKEVILAVNVTGNFSTEKRSHQIRVHHCLPSKPTK